MKYFVISDIHSFYDEMMYALDNAGYDRTNENHTLIVCGDVFDRGDKTREVYGFLKSVPKNRLILIRGNHEDLFTSLMDKDFPDDYDLSNGTVKTFLSIADLNLRSWMFSSPDISLADSMTTYDMWQSVKEVVRNSEVAEWIQSSDWKNYYELGKYIFVHSFIPLRKNGWTSLNEYFRDWRDSATDEEWFEAKWYNPSIEYLDGMFEEELADGKVLVCGHWHTSDFYKNIDGDFSPKIEEFCPIYMNGGIIGLDACTAYTNRCNCLVINDDMSVSEYSSGYYKRG